MASCGPWKAATSSSSSPVSSRPHVVALSFVLPLSRSSSRCICHIILSHDPFHPLLLLLPFRIFLSCLFLSILQFPFSSGPCQMTAADVGSLKNPSVSLSIHWVNRAVMTVLAAKSTQQGSTLCLCFLSTRRAFFYGTVSQLTFPKRTAIRFYAEMIHILLFILVHAA